METSCIYYPTKEIGLSIEFLGKKKKKDRIVKEEKNVYLSESEFELKLKIEKEEIKKDILLLNTFNEYKKTKNENNKPLVILGLACIQMDVPYSIIEAIQYSESLLKENKELNIRYLFNNDNIKEDIYPLYEEYEILCNNIPAYNEKKMSIALENIEENHNTFLIIFGSSILWSRLFSLHPKIQKNVNIFNLCRNPLYSVNKQIRFLLQYFNSEFFDIILAMESEIKNDKTDISLYKKYLNNRYEYILKGNIAFLDEFYKEKKIEEKLYIIKEYEKISNDNNCKINNKNNIIKDNINKFIPSNAIDLFIYNNEQEIYERKNKINFNRIHTIELCPYIHPPILNLSLDFSFSRRANKFYFSFLNTGNKILNFNFINSSLFKIEKEENCKFVMGLNSFFGEKNFFVGIKEGGKYIMGYINKYSNKCFFTLENMLKNDCLNSAILGYIINEYNKKMEITLFKYVPIYLYEIRGYFLPFLYGKVIPDIYIKKHNKDIIDSFIHFSIHISSGDIIIQNIEEYNEYIFNFDLLKMDNNEENNNVFKIAKLKFLYEHKCNEYCKKLRINDI